jgi:hypothetical protein
MRGLNIDKSFVSVAVDLSRLPDDAIAETGLATIVNVGREVDLLETIRRTEKNAVVPLDILKIEASRLRIPGELFNVVTIIEFQKKKVLNIIDDDKVQLHFQNSSDVYSYGLQRISEMKDAAQLKFLEILSKTLVKPAPVKDFYDILGLFPKHFRDGLWNFVVRNKVLIPFQYNNEGFLISHRLYKDEKKFRMALEILKEQKLENIVEFLQNNPGNPLPVVSQRLNAKENSLYLLCKYGILEPIKLEVQGDAKEYLFSPTSTLSREDKDHFDLVKMTLANFRFGEYYSKKTRLWSLDKFFTRILDKGFAGSAEAIGTDYQNLENKVVRVQKIDGTNYRFWLLKRDVIEDARNIMRGEIPIHSTKSVGNLTDINNLIQTRSQIDVELARASEKEVLKALREINEGACS